MRQEQADRITDWALAFFVRSCPSGIATVADFLKSRRAMAPPSRQTMTDKDIALRVFNRLTVQRGILEVARICPSPDGHPYSVASAWRLSTGGHRFLQEQALKPCPFCGFEVGEDLDDVLYPSGSCWRYEEFGDSTYRHYISLRDRKPGDGFCWSMHCTASAGGCGAEVGGHSAAEAVAAWNRRPVMESAS